MRIYPPVRFSIPYQFQEPVENNGKDFCALGCTVIYIAALHMNKEEWQDPEKFLPERFDPLSPYFLTSSGKKRHPMSLPSIMCK